MHMQSIWLKSFNQNIIENEICCQSTVAMVRIPSKIAQYLMPKLFNFCGSPRYIFDLIRHIQSLDSNRYYSSGGNKKIPNRS